MVQVNNTPINLRIKFKKVGRLQYISHLDLVRTMHKVIVRAGLPLWYTEGFNPKPKMVFAAPLSIGTESVSEFLDIRLTERMPPEEAIARMNKNMAGELQALEAYYPESKLADLKWLAYTIVIKNAFADSTLTEKCERALLDECVEVKKRAKSGDKVTVNIRSLIKTAKCELDADGIRISCVLSADPSAYLNPEYIVKVLREKCGILADADLTKEYYSIMRENAYFADMTEFR